MRAVDTNVLARFLARDDEAQTMVADQVMLEPTFVPLTVLLETVWVLASSYGQTRQAIYRALTELVQMPSVTTVDYALVRWAIDRFGAGADFVDLAHLIDGRSAESFATFDRGVAKGAGDDPPLPVETLRV